MSFEAAKVRKRRLLFVVTEDWYFCSHRLHLAVAAAKQGYEVAVATRLGKHEREIRDAGIEIHHWDIDRGSTSLVSTWKSLRSLFHIFRSARPDILHQVALKPVLFGSFLAWFLGIHRVVNALGGMGSLFNVNRRSWIRALVTTSLRILFWNKRAVVILQNPEDCNLLQNEANVSPEKIFLVRGAGVDVQKFSWVPEIGDIDTPLVVLPARMLWDKGIGEYVASAKIIKERGAKARFVLVGPMDAHNPTAIDQTQIDAWVADGIVEWWGMRDDMPEVLRMAHIVCLPSYREGLPKALLEAAASGRPIVATNVPGCREVVKDGENGLLVPVRNIEALAEALLSLIESPGLRKKYGQKGRELVQREFSDEIVVGKTLAIYDRLFLVK